MSNEENIKRMMVKLGWKRYDKDLWTKGMAVCSLGMAVEMELKELMRLRLLG